jgi:flagellar M-ring protein FliF
VNSLFDQLKAFGVGRLVSIFGLSIGVAVALVYFSGAVGGGSQALLYSGLDPADAAAASERLGQANIPYEIREGGTAIYVPRGQVDEARVRVASEGALGFGSVGYEIFDDQDSMGTTSFVQNMNAKRAAEGELARTIQSLSAISSARVHLVLPERRLFEQDRQQPSASVVIGVRGSLNSDQVRTIRNIVATAVPGLEPGRITLADESGRQLAGVADEGGAGSAMFDERRTAVEADLRGKILDVLEGVVGVGGVRVQVSAELDRASITESSEIIDPESQVVLSRDTTEEANEEVDGQPNAVSATENLPGAADGGEAGTGPRSNSERASETVNFEYSRVTRAQVLAAGAISRLSVAVAVDYIAETAEDGTTTYRARTDEEMADLTALVRSAMGYDETRDAEPIVEQMQFARADVSLGTAASTPFSFDKNDIMRAAEIAVLFITAMLIIFLVARPLVKGAQGGAAPALALAAGAPAAAFAAAGGAPAALPDGGPVATVLPGPGGGPIEDAIDIAKIDGQVKASSVKKVASIVEQHPEESIAILRSWLHES